MGGSVAAGNLNEAFTANASLSNFGTIEADSYVIRAGRYVDFNIVFSAKSGIGEATYITLGTLNSGYRPFRTIYPAIMVWSGTTPSFCAARLDASSGVVIYGLKPGIQYTFHVMYIANTSI